MQVFGAEGFGDDFHESLFHKVDPHIFIYCCGKGDGGNGRIELSDLGEGGGSVHLGHFEVDEYQVESSAAKFLNGLEAIDGLMHLDAPFGEEFTGDGHIHEIVFRDEDPELVEDGQLLDDVSMTELFLADPQMSVDDLIGPPWPVTVTPDAGVEEIAERLAETRHTSVVVVTVNLAGFTE